MQPKDIDIFFEHVDQRVEQPLDVRLLGGAAGLIYGNARPTEDIDFEIGSSENDDRLVAAFKYAEEKTRIRAEYSKDVDHWSMISFGDYREHMRPYKKIGKVSIVLLAPEHWSIGKVARFYDTDVGDMIAVFKAQKTDLAALLQVWKGAMSKSPLSSSLFQFKQQVCRFVELHGPAIWQAQSDTEQLLDKFQKR